jgi:hypothetical protein
MDKGLFSETIEQVLGKVVTKTIYELASILKNYQHEVALGFADFKNLPVSCFQGKRLADVG